MVALGCGTLYIYSAFAPQLSDRLKLSATQVSTIGIIGNLSMSISGPIAGLIVDRYGFVAPIVASAVCNLTGYSLVRILFVNGTAYVPLLALALVLIGFSSTFAFSASVKCAAVNCAQFRGFATSVVMAGYGLSAFVLSYTANRVVPEDTEGFLSLLSFLPTALFIIFGPQVCKFDPLRHPVGKKRDDPDDEVIDLMPLQLAPSDDLVGVPTMQPGTRGSLDLTREAIIEQAKEVSVHWSELMKTPEFWCYSALLGFLAAMGQTYIYGCGYMVKALTMTKNEHVWQSRQVAILSISNFGGRVLAGLLSDFFKNTCEARREWVLLPAITVCLITQIVAFHTGHLYTLSFLSTSTGLFYGLTFGSFPGIIGDAYGIKHFSSNWGIIAMSPIPVSYYLTRKLAKVYDAGSTNGVCIGPYCFQAAFKLTIILSVMLYGVLFYLLIRYRKSVKKLSK